MKLSELQIQQLLLSYNKLYCMWKCLYTKPILPQAVSVYIKYSDSPHCYYSKVVKETGELDTVIVELPTKKKTHC